MSDTGLFGHTGGKQQTTNNQLKETLKGNSPIKLAADAQMKFPKWDSELVCSKIRHTCVYRHGLKLYMKWNMEQLNVTVQHWFL